MKQEHDSIRAGIVTVLIVVLISVLMTMPTALCSIESSVTNSGNTCIPINSDYHYGGISIPEDGNHKLVPGDSGFDGHESCEIVTKDGGDDFISGTGGPGLKTESVTMTVKEGTRFIVAVEMNGLKDLLNTAGVTVTVNNVDHNLNPKVDESISYVGSNGVFATDQDIDWNEVQWIEVDQGEEITTTVDARQFLDIGQIGIHIVFA